MVRQSVSHAIFTELVMQQSSVLYKMFSTAIVPKTIDYIAYTKMLTIPK